MMKCLKGCVTFVNVKVVRVDKRWNFFGILRDAFRIGMKSMKNPIDYSHRFTTSEFV